MACDGGKGMIGSMQMYKEEELLQQQPLQQQPQPPGIAAPHPWPRLLSADYDESNNERQIRNGGFLDIGLGGRAKARSFVFAK